MSERISVRVVENERPTPEGELVYRIIPLVFNGQRYVDSRIRQITAPREMTDAELGAAVKQQGRYTTLLQALDTMALDRQAWKMFAEQRVRAYWKSRGATS